MMAQPQSQMVFRRSSRAISSELSGKITASSSNNLGFI